MPSLDSVTLHKVILGYCSSVELILDIPFPENPPKKWVIRNNNRVQICLCAATADCFLVSGWLEQRELNTISINMHKEGDVVHLDAKNDTIRIKLNTRCLYVKDIKSYRA